MGSVRNWYCVCYDIYEPKRLRLFPKKGCVKFQFAGATNSNLIQKINVDSKHLQKCRCFFHAKK